ncbi:MAG TPA: class I SAM-dependent methyltransferase [Trichormus sp.]|jgi:SAM-dependent methyltransferase
MRSNRQQFRSQKKAQAAPFGAYARVYDLLCSDKNAKDNCLFIQGLMHDFVPGAKTILDLGCGTGSHALELAELGYNVCGIDSSKSMLEQVDAHSRGAEHARGLIDLHHDDMRTARLNREFDVVVALDNSIGYQVSNDDLRNTLQTMREHLRPGGMFLFDCWYGPAVLHKLPQRRVKCAQTDQLSVTRTANPETLPNQNAVEINYEIVVRNKISGIEETIQELHKIRYFFIPDMKALCASVGLEVIAVGECLTDREPSLTTWHVYFAGRATTT